MASVISFMTSILFCGRCDDGLKCGGFISCPWLSPHDEANCPQQCPSSSDDQSSIWYNTFFIPCDCNKPGNMTCQGRGFVCYTESGKFLVLFYFCKCRND